MEKSILQNTLEITRTIFHDVYEKGNYDTWFSYLYVGSIYNCRGEPILYGANAIINHYKETLKPISNVVDEEYHRIYLEDKVDQVLGHITVRNDNDFTVTSQFSITYKLIGNETKIVSQMMYYDHEFRTETGKCEPLKMDLNTTKYVRKLLLDAAGKRIPIKSAMQTIFVDPNTILYVNSQRKKTEIICIDRNLTANHSFGELCNILPNNFYSVRRGTLVNTSYITGIRYHELELISGINISIPEKKYSKVKSDLINYIT